MAETDPAPDTGSTASQPKPAPTRAAPRRDADKPSAAPRVAAATPAGAGLAVLMIGSKPPCFILIDGRQTGLVTPQRSIKVTPGPHRIMLVNREHGIMETFNITAVAGKPLRLVKDLTSKMRR